MPISSLTIPEEQDTVPANNNTEAQPSNSQNSLSNNLNPFDSTLDRPDYSLELHSRANTINREVNSIVNGLPAGRIQQLRSEGFVPLTNLASAEANKVQVLSDSPEASKYYAAENEAASNIERAFGDQEKAGQLFSEIKSMALQNALDNPKLYSLEGSMKALGELTFSRKYPQLLDPTVYGEAAKWIFANLAINGLFPEAVKARIAEMKSSSGGDQFNNTDARSFYNSIGSK